MDSCDLNSDSQTTNAIPFEIAWYGFSDAKISIVIAFSVLKQLANEVAVSTFLTKKLSKKWGLVLVFGLVWPQLWFKHNKTHTGRKSLKRWIRCCNFDRHSALRSPAISQWSSSIHFFEEKLEQKMGFS